MSPDPRIALVKKRSKTVHFCWVYEDNSAVSMCGLFRENLNDESAVKEIETFSNSESPCKSCAAKKKTRLWDCCSLYGQYPWIEEEFFRHMPDS